MPYHAIPFHSIPFYTYRRVQVVPCRLSTEVRGHGDRELRARRLLGERQLQRVELRHGEQAPSRRNKPLACVLVVLLVCFVVVFCCFVFCCFVFCFGVCFFGKIQKAFPGFTCLAKLVKSTEEVQVLFPAENPLDLAFGVDPL